MIKALCHCRSLKMNQLFDIFFGSKKIFIHKTKYTTCLHYVLRLKNIFFNISVGLRGLQDILNQLHLAKTKILLNLHVNS